MADEERRRFHDSNLLETILEQQDDENTVSSSTSPTIDADSFDRQRKRDQEEIQQFEALEKQFSSPRHGIRVHFSSKNDDLDQNRVESIFPDGEKTVVRTLPLFYVKSNEDQVTKHFYENPFNPNESSIDENVRRQSPSEVDSLEEADNSPLVQSTKKSETKTTDDRSEPNATNKSILKKKLQRDKTSRSPSPSTSNLQSHSNSKRKPPSTNNDETNEFPYLAELTAKQVHSINKLPVRSLFEPTINIFQSSSSNGSSQIRRRPSRLRYYIKPYRGEANLPPSELSSKQRSRSLSEQRIEQQQSGSARWFTFSNQYQSNVQGRAHRKQHVSWSPVREYIQQGRDKYGRVVSTKEKPNHSSTDKSNVLKKEALSSSSPCIASALSTEIRRVAKHIQEQSPTDNGFERTNSCPDRTDSTAVTPSSISEQERHRETDKNSPGLYSSSEKLPTPIRSDRRETLERYDRLLEKMKMTDEQLQKLSRSWNISNDQRPSKFPFDKKTNNDSRFQQQFDPRLTSNQTESWTSTMILQMCLFFLVIFNIFLVYFFKDIHLWWDKYLGASVIVEQPDPTSSKF